jgi:hypothetical protein
VKLALEAEHVSDISDIRSGVTELLKGFPQQDFKGAFEDLYKRPQRCLELGAIILKVCKENFA